VFFSDNYFAAPFFLIESSFQILWWALIFLEAVKVKNIDLLMEKILKSTLILAEIILAVLSGVHFLLYAKYIFIMVI